MQLMLQERGLIYISKHEGWYSVSDETFYPASAVQLALDPATGRKFMVRSANGTKQIVSKLNAGVQGDR